jgi:Ets-domain/Sterile alpha motif (SAM)/Pointed domain
MFVFYKFSSYIINAGYSFSQYTNRKYSNKHLRFVYCENDVSPARTALINVINIDMENDSCKLFDAINDVLKEHDGEEVLNEIFEMFDGIEAVLNEYGMDDIETEHGGDDNYEDHVTDDNVFDIALSDFGRKNNCDPKQLTTSNGADAEADADAFDLIDLIGDVYDIAICDFRPDVMCISPDPKQWSSSDVGKCINWIIKTFALESGLNDYNGLNGLQIINEGRDCLMSKIPGQLGDILWRLLVKLTTNINANINNTNFDDHIISPGPMKNQKNRKRAYASGGREILLWQFILDLLVDNDYTNVVSWTGNEREFKIHDRCSIAYLWGMYKNNINMRFSRFKRTMLNYCKKGIVERTHEDYVYRFTTDVHNLMTTIRKRNRSYLGWYQTFMQKVNSRQQ